MADEAAKIHVGDVGTELVVEFKDEAGGIVDISGCTELLIYLTDPSGTIVELTGEFDDDGTDGLAKYVTEAGDLTTDGGWSIEGWVDLGTEEFSTLISDFEVFPSKKYPDGDNR